MALNPRREAKRRALLRMLDRIPIRPGNAASKKQRRSLIQPGDLLPPSTTPLQPAPDKKIGV